MRHKNQSGTRGASQTQSGFFHTLLLAVFILLIGAATNQRAVGESGFLQSRIAQASITQERKADQSTSGELDSTTSPHNQDRGAFTLPKALLGHWINQESKSRMFYSQGMYISVYSGKAHEGRYSVEEVNEGENWMRIQISPIHSRIFTFSTDKTEISDIAEIAGIRATKDEAIIWTYVDDSQKPPGAILKSTEGDEAVLEVITTPERPKPEFFRGDSRSKIYYWRGCPGYEEVPLQRRVYFRTKKEAQKDGYRAAKKCP